MPIYTVEMDGRQYDIEGDRPPSEAEARAAIGSHSNSQTPKQATPPPAAATMGMMRQSTAENGDPGYWEKHPTQAHVARGITSTLPALGALAGGAIASPTLLSGFGPVVGAGIGAGAGRGAQDLITEAMGLEQPSSALDKGARIGVDAALTAGTAAVVPGVVAAIKTPLRTTGEIAQKFIPRWANNPATEDAVAWMTKRPTITAPPRVTIENLGGTLRPGTTPAYKPPIQSAISDGLEASRPAPLRAQIAPSNPAGGGFTVPAGSTSTRPMVSFSPRAKEVLDVMSRPAAAEETLFQQLSKKLVLSPEEAATLDRLRRVMGQRASNMGTSYAARAATGK